jgi:hypothetical protein
VAEAGEQGTAGVLAQERDVCLALDNLVTNAIDFVFWYVGPQLACAWCSRFR